MDITAIKSSDENVTKLVFKYETGVAEAVLYKYPTYKERTVICCSVMSGCPVGCRFCGTGDFFVRNLTSDEIIGQVVEALLVAMSEENFNPATIMKFQIMFMSMGEPLLNWKHLKKAIKILHLMYPSADLLISTMGPDVPDKIWDELSELSVEIPKIGLQFSIHESSNEVRDKLIPFKAKMSLGEIAYRGYQWWLRTKRPPFFNYCVHDGNDKCYDLTRLQYHFPQGIWQATLSVICERDESIAGANDRQRNLVSSFMEKMLMVGYSVRMFDPAGQDDIGGGCGQLFHVQDWVKEHPQYAKKSAGNGLPKVHMPTEV